jgi:hypothetical protein
LRAIKNIVCCGVGINWERIDASNVVFDAVSLPITYVSRYISANIHRFHAGESASDSWSAEVRTAAESGEKYGVLRCGDQLGGLTRNGDRNE